MITENYVSFETAKLLKEKGFDEPTGFVYSENGELLKLSDFGVRYLLNSECDDYPHWQFPFEGVASIVSAPTIQMTMKWLRETKDIQIEISIVGTDTWKSPTKWMYGFRCQTKDVIDRRNADFSSYEEACETAIRYCLENLI